MPALHNQWRRTAKIVSTTVLITSAVWLIGGAILFEKLRQTESSEVPARPVQIASSSRAGTDRPTLQLAVLPSAKVPRLMVPVADVRPDQLADTFTQAREGGARRHNAIDIMAPLGTPVLATAAGQVARLFVSVRGGNTVYVRSPDRTLIYYYAHLDAYAPGLLEGDRKSVV